MKLLARRLSHDLGTIRSQCPVILSLTNSVAMDLTANALLAIGASPIMAQASEELDELVSIARAVVLNSGTLDTRWIENAEIIVRAARRSDKPVVLDPVGAGASRLRTQVGELLLGRGVTVVRANASEINALLGGAGETRGVDSTISSRSILDLARKKTRDEFPVLAISGEEDFILHEGRLASLRGGNALMKNVTAMGCTATSLIAAFLAVNPSPYFATVHALAAMKIAGTRAARRGAGPGSFRSAFLDSLYDLASSVDEDEIDGDFS